LRDAGNTTLQFGEPLGALEKVSTGQSSGRLAISNLVPQYIPGIVLVSRIFM
jgi:hypothetical protein